MSYNPQMARTLFSRGNAATHTGDTSRTSLFTYTMKAGTMGVNDYLELWMFRGWTNSANNKLYEVSMGGTNIFSRTVNTTASSIGVVTVTNRNSLSSQLLFVLSADIGLGISGTTNSTISVDTSVDVTFEWFVTLTNSGETAGVQGVVLTLYKSPS
jgi:hypothetical protein